MIFIFFLSFLCQMKMARKITGNRTNHSLLTRMRVGSGSLFTWGYLSLRFPVLVEKGWIQKKPSWPFMELHEFLEHVPASWLLSRAVGSFTWILLPYHSMSPKQSHLKCMSQDRWSFPSAMWSVTEQTRSSEKLHLIGSMAVSFWVIVWKLFSLLWRELSP